MPDSLAVHKRVIVSLNRPAGGDADGVAAAAADADGAVDRSSSVLKDAEVRLGDRSWHLAWSWSMAWKDFRQVETSLAVADDSQSGCSLSIEAAWKIAEEIVLAMVCFC